MRCVPMPERRSERGFSCWVPVWGMLPHSAPRLERGGAQGAPLLPTHVGKLGTSGPGRTHHGAMDGFSYSMATAPKSRCRSLGCVWSCVLATLLALGDHARILQAPFHPVAAHQAAPELCAGLTPGTRRASLAAWPRSQYPNAKERNTQIPQAPVNTQPTECRPC